MSAATKEELLAQHDKAVAALDMGQNGKFALTETTPWEGVTSTDGTTYAGITQETLDAARDDISGLPAVPGKMTMEQLAKVQQWYIDHEALKYVGGSAALENIPGQENAAAFLDTLYRHGPNKGFDRLEIATENIIANLPEGQAQWLGVKAVDPDTGTAERRRLILQNYANLCADPEYAKALRKELANVRAAKGAVTHVENGKTVKSPLEGDRKRYQYFSYQ